MPSKIGENDFLPRIEALKHHKMPAAYFPSIPTEADPDRV